MGETPISGTSENTNENNNFNSSEIVKPFNSKEFTVAKMTNLINFFWTKQKITTF